MQYTPVVQKTPISGPVGAVLGGTALGGVALAAITRYLGGGPVAPASVNAWHGGYVTEREAVLMSENASLKAEKYADAADRPLEARICELEKLAAVNAARDQDFRRYTDHEFVHQPKVKMHNGVIETKPCDCCCND